MYFAGGYRPRHPGIKPLTALTAPATAIPDGGVLSLSPADATFSLLSCPHPPNPRSQSALPDRKGEIFVILLQGASPLASPGAGGTRHWFGGRWRRPAGACPVGRRFYLPFRHPAGGLPSLSPAYPAFSLFVCPHPPTPLPSGKGEIFRFFMQGASPLASPGLGGARHWIGKW